MKFTFYHPANAMDCGPTCLRMVAKHYGKYYSADSIRSLTGFGKEGVSLLGLSEAAESIGFRSRGVRLSYEELVSQAPLPCILHWNQNHFVILIRAYRAGTDRALLKIADPNRGVIHFSKKEFQDSWIKADWEDGTGLGTALLLEPGGHFFSEQDEKEIKADWRSTLQYLNKHLWGLSQVMFALIITSLVQLLIPFLTQGIVDTGIPTQNIQYIIILLIAQLMLILSRTMVDFIRTRLLMRISMFVNFSILSDFWIKLTRLPISYFDRHHTGDILQRLSDTRQVQSFLTGSALNTLFSLFNFVVYAFVLILYDIQLFLVFFVGSIFYFGWVRLFLRIRRKINYQTFHLSAQENNSTLQLVQGMQEIRLNNAEQLKRWDWENIQSKIFKLNYKALTYTQVQQAGALLITQGKDIIITFLVAKLVIDGKLTLGAMLAIQYVIGQLSGPIDQFVGFIQSAQDAKISMERLNEVHLLADEENSDTKNHKRLPETRNITLSNLSFAYPGIANEPVLKNINLEIPAGKITAVVGVSGSGKTTLLKLLLKFYDSYSGIVKIGETNFKYISPSFWRKNCSAVMQDGYIFNDSIARNIAVSDEQPEYDRLIPCCKAANILSFIESLPNGYNTRLGADGVGVSQGQKQRLLIARAIYKNPDYILFDEATNSLDANNEKTIVENMQEFFRNKTVVIVAHRLSTVKNADKIIVLHNGSIVEEGSHQYLTERRGNYYELVKNQLELGN